MPSESSTTVGEYLQTQTGLRNLMLALVIFIIPMSTMYSYSGVVPLLKVLLALLLTVGVFINLWREVVIWLVLSYLVWEFVVWNLWWELGRTSLIPFVFMIVLVVVGYGFVLGELVNRRLESWRDNQTNKGRANRIIEMHWAVARFGMQISRHVSLSNLDTVPLFALPVSHEQRAQEPNTSDSLTTSYIFKAPILEEPMSELDIDLQSKLESAPIFKSLEQPEAPKTGRSVMSAPLAGSGLYVYTFILEFVGAVARSLVIAFVATIVLSPLYVVIFASTTWDYSDPGQWLKNNTLICFVISALIGVGLGFQPLVNSLFHILFPFLRSGSGPTERDTLGAREPTRDEMETIIDTVQRIQAASGKTIKRGAPSQWLVLDEPFPDAYTIGSTVYLTRAALENDNLAGIMAHEMGHIAHKDGDLLLSLRRFIVPLAYWVGIDRQATAAGAVLGTGSTARLGRTQTDDEKIFFRFQALKIKLWLAFWFGGLGLLILGRSWAQFWRQRDFLADDYAVKLG